MAKTLDLTPEQFDGWLAALRSGEYVHGRAMLRDVKEDGTNTYCCLGVLQALYDFPASMGGDEFLNADPNHGDVPIKLVIQRVLAELNDRLGNEKEAEKPWVDVPEEEQGQGDGRPVFEQVADYIEQHYEPRVTA